MAETVAHKEQMASNETRHRGVRTVPNWLFACMVCGQPITFDEPLATWTRGDMVQVAHCRCVPDRCRHGEG